MTDAPAPHPHILFVAHDTEKSGAPRVTLTLAQALADRGYPVTVCFPGTGDLESEARVLGLNTVVVPNEAIAFANVRGLLARFRVISQRLAVIGRTEALIARIRADLVWVGSDVALFPALGARRSGRPLIVHVHQVVPGTANNRLRVRLIKWAATALVFVARRSQPAFEPKPRSQPWVLLPNFIDTRPIDRARRDTGLRAQFGAGDQDVVIMTTAHIYPHKGIDVLLEAFAIVGARHANVRLWIAGAEPDDQAEFLAMVRGLANRPGARGRVSFLGQRDDVPALLKSADVFTLASRTEALPLSIAEAMAAGLPVVATNVGSIDDMIAQGTSGYVVPKENPSELAGALARYVEDAGLRAAHGAAGRDRAHRLFDREAILDQAEDLIRALTAG